MKGIATTEAPQEKLSFEEYFQDYYPNLFYFFRTKISSVQSAEDLAMDTFTACLKKFDSFDPAKATFGTWLYSIANNKLKNYFRDHKIFDEFDETSGIQESFEDSVLAAEHLSAMRNVLYDALKSLPEVQRKIVVYKFVYNKNSNEIALLVGLTPGNVRQQLSRVIKKLKTYFDSRDVQWES